ncbi:phosphatase [Pelagibacterales bacterium SAG-MED23]|nr:phosphatase [Pelagibacterales bacterium SAG-MED23]
MKINPNIFILDVDGVLTTGTFFYDSKGKILKEFGPDDHDALKILSKYLKIIFISADKKGFKISEKRIVRDMKFELFYVSSSKRYEWIYKNYKRNKIIYMGDGIFDQFIMDKFFYSISTQNSYFKTKKKSKYVTKSNSGNRAVAEACEHILKKFFKKNII